MSHSTYTVAELEEMRKAQIKQEIDGLIAHMISKKRNLTFSRINAVVFNSSDSESNESEVIETGINMGIDIKSNNPSIYQEDIKVNITSLSISSQDYKNKIMKMVSDIKKIKVPYHISKEHSLVITWIENCLENMEVDKNVFGVCEKKIHDFIDLYNNYTNVFKKYIVLCELVGVKINKDMNIVQMEKCINEYDTLLQINREREYILSSTKEVLEELGYTVEKSFILDEADDNITGVLLDNDDVKGNKLFVGMDGDGLVLETMLDDLTTGVTEFVANESAKVVCAHKKVVQEKLRERGIIVKMESDLLPELSEMYRLSSYSSKKTSIEEMYDRRTTEGYMSDE